MQTVIHYVICLANSYKLGGRCFAGRLIRGDEIGPWVRPIGSGQGGALLVEETMCHDGRSPAVLDIVGIPLLTHEPRLHQREDWSFDLTQQWRRADSLPRTRTGLDPLLSPQIHLWSNHSSSTHGVADRVPEAELVHVPNSLRFIYLDFLELKVAYVDNKWNCRARFMYLGTRYNLSVTDPQYDMQRLGEEPKTVTIDDCYVTISLGEPFKGFAYKLVAGIVEL